MAKTYLGVPNRKTTTRKPKKEYQMSEAMKKWLASPEHAAAEAKKALKK